MAKCVLFDFDGTIADTGAGVIECARHTLSQFGIPSGDDEAMRLFVGPPLRYTFGVYGVPKDRIEEAVAIFRRFYQEDGGKYKVSPYPGIGDLLKRLQEKGLRLFIATSKPEHLAVELLEIFGMENYFERICGATLDGTRDQKEKVITYLLNSLEDKGDCIMVGDTAFDVIGARAHGIPTVGVSWGFGSREEMVQAGAAAVVDTMEELESYLLNH